MFVDAEKTKNLIQWHSKGETCDTPRKHIWNWQEEMKLGSTRDGCRAVRYG
jgi:hypothetical protein